MAEHRSNNPSLLPYSADALPSGYGSINGYSFNDDSSIMEGISVEGKLSQARRFFIFLTLFDVLFCTLVWIICTVVSDESSIIKAFTNEIIEYNIDSSMFDIVILAVARFFIIIFFYIFIRLSHYSIIAFTTAGTTAFIVAKVFLYKWAHSGSVTAAIVLLLSSFILSWSEAWFLDFRVLPKESKALAFLKKYEEDHEHASAFVHPRLSRSQSDDGGDFYSPQVSDGEDSERDSGRVLNLNSASDLDGLFANNKLEMPSDQEYRKLAEEALEKAIGIVESNGWKKEKHIGDDKISSKSIPVYGKVYKFEGIIQAHPDILIDLLYSKAEEVHKWNPTVKRIKVIQKVDDNVDVTHVIATEGASGIVASRDFVNLRIWKKQGSVYIHGSVATTHPTVPETNKYVRGEQGPCVYIITPLDDNMLICKLQWLLITDLKGWIPQYLIDQTLSTVMMEYVHSLRKHLSS